jgi:hypothetical protein
MPEAAELWPKQGCRQYPGWARAHAEPPHEGLNGRTREADRHQRAAERLPTLLTETGEPCDMPDDAP